MTKTCFYVRFTNGLRVCASNYRGILSLHELDNVKYQTLF